jgi:hypothetical protein
LNDPAAPTCTMTRFDLDQAIPVDPESAHLYCRERFEITGTDPAFPSG